MKMSCVIGEPVPHHMVDRHNGIIGYLTNDGLILSCDWSPVYPTIFLLHAAKIDDNHNTSNSNINNNNFLIFDTLQTLSLAKKIVVDLFETSEQHPTPSCLQLDMLNYHIVRQLLRLSLSSTNYSLLWDWPIDNSIQKNMYIHRGP